MLWDTSCPDWEDRIRQGKSLVPKLPLFKDEARNAVELFKRLRIPNVFGKPTMADTAGPWIYPIIEAIFGSFDPKTRQRMIQEFFLLVPKKNGKTVYASAIMIVAMLMNRRPNAEFNLIAPTKEIASRSFRNIANMVKADPLLHKLFLIKDHEKTINFVAENYEGSGSYLKVISSDLQTITGTTALFVLVDEVHEFSKHANAKQVFVEIRGALGANPDGCLIQISTQSKDVPAGAFKSELRNARAVRDGASIEVDEEDGEVAPQSLLPIIYELPDDLTADEGWKKRSVWPLVNPNLNLSVRESFLVGELSKAEADGAGAVGLFASQHLNIEIGLAHKNDGWAGQHYWDESGEPSLTLKELIAASDVITAGVDGGGLDDLLSVSFIGRVKGSHEWLHWSQTWAHKIVLERRKSEAPKLLDFAKDKDLIIVDDLKVAFNDVANLILSVDKSGKLKDIGFDTYGVVLIVEALQAAGIPKERIAGVRQGWSLQGAIKSAEVKLASGELTHANQPIMRWAVENAKIEIRGNAIAITKQTSGTAKIDPLMAMFDAVWVMSEIPENDVSGWQTDDMAALIKKIEAATAAAR